MTENELISDWEADVRVISFILAVTIVLVIMGVLF